MFGAEPMTVPHSGIQYAQPSSWKEPDGIFRLAASACVVMPIAAQTAAVIAIIRAILMLCPRGWRPASGGLTNKQAGSMLRNQTIAPHPAPAVGLATSAPAHVRFGPIADIPLFDQGASDLPSDMRRYSCSSKTWHSRMVVTT